MHKNEVTININKGKIVEVPVVKEIVKESKKDRSKIQVEEFTKLNLMEITRKHINSKKTF